MYIYNRPKGLELPKRQCRCENGKIRDSYNSMYLDTDYIKLTIVFMGIGIKY